MIELIQLTYPMTARTEMLPLSDLMTCPFLPHLAIVIEAFRIWSVVLEGKVLLLARIILKELTLRSANHDIIRFPREFLYIWTVVGQIDRAAIPGRFF